MDLVADRYELFECLGQGGMARVHAARDRVLDRRVAVKLLHDDIGRDPVLRERFLREAKLAARLNHSNIVRVYDAGIEADTPWMAMELVDGPSLLEEMTGAGPLDTTKSVEVVAQVLQALGAAHAAGVIHRDVKPANVLLTAQDAKLSDFGIAKSLQGGGDLTQTNRFIGTPKYIAPEVATGMPASSRSDIYSAAVVLWEMLAGSPPFQHDNPVTLAMMHQTDPLPSLSGARPDLPLPLVQAVETGLAKEPAGRPDDAQAYADLLLSASTGRSPATDAALSPTVMIRPPVAPTPVPREQTLALSRPSQPLSDPPPAKSSRRGGWGVAAVITVLLGVAVVAFAMTSFGTSGTATLPAVTPTAGTPSPVPTPVPVGTEPVAPPPESAVVPAPTATVTVPPTPPTTPVTPVPAQATAPVQTPAPPPTPEPVPPPPGTPGPAVSPG